MNFTNCLFILIVYLTFGCSEKSVKWSNFISEHGNYQISIPSNTIEYDTSNTPFLNDTINFFSILTTNDSIDWDNSFYSAFYFDSLEKYELLEVARILKIAETDGNMEKQIKYIRDIRHRGHAGLEYITEFYFGEIYSRNWFFENNNRLYYLSVVRRKEEDLYDKYSKKFLKSMRFIDR